MYFKVGAFKENIRWALKKKSTGLKMSTVVVSAKRLHMISSA
jgi:hypothetical protein